MKVVISYDGLMHQRDGNIPDHLLHILARELWNMDFLLFGVDWVMPRCCTAFSLLVGQVYLVQ